VDPAQFLTDPRVTIVAGKGGVGKTTAAATLALAASRLGISALLIDIDGKSTIPGLFGVDSAGYDEVVLHPGGGGTGEIRARSLTPDDALIEYLEDHGLRRISKRLTSSGALDMVATATPGIRDVLVLGKIKQLERAGAAEAIIVDAPAAGHAISFLRSAEGLLDAVSVGPIETQAREVRNLLADPRRCQVLLVTLPEETPVNELIETAYSLEDRVGVALAPILVNGVYPDLPGLSVDPEAAAAEAGVILEPDEARRLSIAVRFRRERRALQQAQLDRLATDLPLEQMKLPFLFTADLNRRDLEVLADHLVDAIGALPDREVLR
jgi:anion-transporting  ArsA/GET3 family ATPase